MSFGRVRGLFQMGGVRADPSTEGPAIAMYLRGDDGMPHAFTVEVHTVTAAGIARVVSFQDPSLFPAFGLPRSAHPSHFGS